MIWSLLSLFLILNTFKFLNGACTTDCLLKLGESDTFGSNTFGWINYDNASSFNVNLAQLSSLTIYSKEYVNGISFKFLNGDIQQFGGLLHSSEPIITEIDLQNKQIVCINLRAGWWIDNIQFIIYDTIDNTYNWTQVLGNPAGKPDSVNAETLAPQSSNFQITSITGSADYLDIRTLTFGYTASFCNPIVTTTLPLTTYYLDPYPYPYTNPYPHPNPYPYP